MGAADGRHLGGNRLDFGVDDGAILFERQGSECLAVRPNVFQARCGVSTRRTRVGAVRVEGHPRTAPSDEQNRCNDCNRTHRILRYLVVPNRPKFREID